MAETQADSGSPVSTDAGQTGTDLAATVMPAAAAAAAAAGAAAAGAEGAGAGAGAAVAAAAVAGAAESGAAVAGGTQAATTEAAVAANVGATRATAADSAVTGAEAPAAGASAAEASAAEAPGTEAPAAEAPATGASAAEASATEAVGAEAPVAGAEAAQAAAGARAGAAGDYELASYQSDTWPLIAELAPTGAIHHLEVWVPNLDNAIVSWGWLLTALGYRMFQDWPGGRSWQAGHSYIVFEQSPGRTASRHDRCRPGLNHLAFHVETRDLVDELTREAQLHGWRLMFTDQHPYAGGPQHYAAYLENSDGFEVELVGH